ncbi:hypothetical protein DR91_2044 [Neisseria lactamica ATCC 23970]|nr:hypothetical protein DR91_2044 [Neisseria lactamica ATCC 23970]
MDSLPCEQMVVFHRILPDRPPGLRLCRRTAHGSSRQRCNHPALRFDFLFDMLRQQVGIELACLRIDCGFTVVIPLGKMFRCFFSCNCSRAAGSKITTVDAGNSCS